MKTHPQPIGACVIVLNLQGEVLMGKRKNAYKSGFYGLPGGRVELNEPLKNTALREVEEETGIIVNDAEYVGVVRENQGEYDFIHFVFLARDIDQSPVLCEPDKCEAWEWISLDAVPNSMVPGHQVAINLLMENSNIADITL